MKNNKTLVRKILSALTLASLTLPLAYAAGQLPQTDLPESIVKADSPNNGIRMAWYDGATTRYAHGVLGDAIEAGELHITTLTGKTLSFVLDSAHVFEDIAPRLADMDGDGKNEIITIRSHKDKGGQIAIYGISKARPGNLSLVATTPYIGQAYRWLAPIGIADFNNDGAMDIAYIDRPHLAKLLRVWSYTPTGLKQIAQATGLTNHRIGDDFITGGVQRCGKQAAMITVDSSWSRVIKTSFENGRLVSKDIGAFDTPTSLAAMLNCQ